MNDSCQLTRLRSGRPRPRRAACRAQAVPALMGGAPGKPLGSPKGTGLPRSGVGTAVEGLRPPRRSHRVVSPGRAQGPVSGLRLPHPGLGLRVLLCSEWGGPTGERREGSAATPPRFVREAPLLEPRHAHATQEPRLVHGFSQHPHCVPGAPHRGDLSGRDKTPTDLPLKCSNGKRVRESSGPRSFLPGQELLHRGGHSHAPGSRCPRPGLSVGCSWTAPCPGGVGW